MLTIRLPRVGRRNDPSFRVILVESKEAAKTGNYKEMLGSYDARTDHVELNRERIAHWLLQGVTVSDTMHNLLISQKIIEGKKINVLPRKSPPKAENETAPEVLTETPAEAPAQAPEADSGDNAVAAEPVNS